MTAQDIDHFRCDNGRWLHCVGFDLCETWAGDGRGEKKTLAEAEKKVEKPWWRQRRWRLSEGRVS